MYTTAFYILFAAIIIAQILFLVSQLKFEPTVKAGKVNDNFQFKSSLVCRRSVPTSVRCDGVDVDVSSLVSLSVRGNSVRDYGIVHNDRILVMPLTEEQKSSITAYPVLVFHIVGRKNKLDSKFKLRKFVGYIDNVANADWAAIYDKYSDRIRASVSRETFVRDCTKKAANADKNDLNAPFVLSETYDEYDNKYKYSLHPVGSVYASVKYVI